MILSVNHTSFTVSDVEKTVAFYRDVLGATMLNISERPPGFAGRVTGIEGAHLKIAYVQLGNHQIELIQYLWPPGEKLDVRTMNVGSAHICFNVENIHAMVEEMRGKGVAFKSDPQEIPTGPNKSGYAVYFTDPDGITLEFIQPPRA